jgi:alpha-amylase
LADIRATTYSHLIQAESEANRIIHRCRSPLGKVLRSRRSWLEWEKADFDGDGVEELLIDGSAFSVYISPEEGGSIFEWDIRSHNYNLSSTLARRPEAYHRVLTEAGAERQAGGESAFPSIHDSIRIKDRNSSRCLVYDSYLRSSLVDHFLSPGTKLKGFAANSYSEMGDFSGQPYELSVDNKSDELRVWLRRSGILRIRRRSLPFELRKEIKLKAGEEKIEIGYQLKNTSDSSVQAVFGSEWNINLLGGGHNEQAYYQVPGITLADHHLDSWGELMEVKKVVLGNRHLGIELELTAEPEIRLWRFPVESISNSEGGIERLYQASCLLVLLPFSLPPAGAASLTLTWRVRPVDTASW